MNVEYVTWVRFTAWWAAKEQGHLAVSHRLLGQIIINDQRVHAVVTEKFAHSRTGVWREVLERSWFGSGCRHDDRVLQRAGFFEFLDHLCNR